MKDETDGGAIVTHYMGRTTMKHNPHTHPNNVTCVTREAPDSPPKRISNPICTGFFYPPHPSHCIERAKIITLKGRSGINSSEGSVVEVRPFAMGCRNFKVESILPRFIYYTPVALSAVTEDDRQLMIKGGLDLEILDTFVK